VLEVGAGTGTNFELYPDTVEAYSATGTPFDAAVCSLVLCWVDEPDHVVRQLLSLLRPGGELRYLEHVASNGARARLQKIADATLWPRIAGNCHTHRHTEETIVGAGFQVSGARRESTLLASVPVPVAEFAIGRAVKPTAVLSRQGRRGQGPPSDAQTGTHGLGCDSRDQRGP
jgi:SAM-dependent methyltransferase